MADSASAKDNSPEVQEAVQTTGVSKDSDGMTVEFDEAEERYLVREGRFECWYEKGPKPLSNFVARIVEETIHDDGAATTRTFAIKGQTDTWDGLPEVSVDAAQFQRMNWIQE